MRHFVTGTTSISCGHRLYLYKGPCNRLHGHNYKISVTISSDCLGSNGMVLDLSQLKKELREITDKWDHRTLLASYDPLKDRALLEKDVVILPKEPTAEVMAEKIAASFKRRYPALSVRVVVQETEKGEAGCYIK